LSDPRPILVPVDFSPHSQAAAKRAGSLARLTGARIHLVHALHLPPGARDHALPSDLWDRLRAAETRRLEEMRAAFEAEGLRVTSTFGEGDPVELIAEQVRREGAEPVVMGTHGYRGLSRLMLGSVAERVLRSLPTPVLAVKESEEEADRAIDRILVATDFSAHAAAAERIATHWALFLGAEVEVFHAIRETAVLFAPYAVAGSGDFRGEMRNAASEEIERIVDRMQAAGLNVRSKLAYGLASAEIVNRAEEWDAQLIVIGRQGHSGLEHLVLGSAAERVLRQSGCSVLVAPPPGGEAESSG